MNETIQSLLKHQSVRRYVDQEIEEEKVQLILDAIQAAPSWINGQQVSVIRVTDQAVRKQLTKLCGNQLYVEQAPEYFVFCIDFYRSALACEIEGKSFAASENIDLLLVGATDVGIAIGTAVAAAESIGLGTIPIGGIRRDVEQVIDILGLPKHVLPVSGLCLGYPAESPGIKPRLAKKAVVFENTYQPNLIEDLKTYNQTFSEYMSKRTNGENSNGWTVGIANFYRDLFYSNNSYQPIEPIMIKQGFLKK